MKAPLLSIIIPVYNAEETVRTVVSHILAQEMRDFELILVNDGSKDKTLEVLHDLAKTDKRIQVLDKTNGGASSARNLGLGKARGKFISFIDADDDIAPKMFTELVNKVAADKVDIVVCQMKQNIIKNDRVATSTIVYAAPLPKQRADEEFRPYIVRLLGINGRLYHPANKIYRAELIKKHVLRFQEGLDFGEDLTFNLHYLSHAKSISFLDKPLYYYNLDIAHGTFGKSSLIYNNRLKNYREVTKLAGKKPSPELIDLLGWIKYYWFYSFVLALCASNLPKKEQVRRLRDALQVDPLPEPGMRQHIGKSKRLMENVLYSLRKQPSLVHSTVRILNFCKSNQLFATVWRKTASRLLR